ncbi:MAG: hypothetical protein NT077_01190 [Candidatus Taylorbacteria bacterium]|nr:hypothetical protein [Candidatus Taylorbacteria bacterium]
MNTNPTETVPVITNPDQMIEKLVRVLPQIINKIIQREIAWEEEPCHSYVPPNGVILWLLPDTQLNKIVRHPSDGAFLCM